MRLTRLLSRFALLLTGLLSACSAHHPARAAAPAPAAVANAEPPMILISIDAFRPDYLQRGVTPNLNALAAGGARASMRPSFPSLTFPNHYTLVTGLRPDHHGVINNTMRDPDRPSVVFKSSDPKQASDRFWWDGGEPFWVSAERAGIRTGTLFWPGSEAAIHGVRPSQWLPYDKALTPNARVDHLLSWFDLPPAQRPRAYTLYFDDVDTDGHHYGPAGAEIETAIARVDAAIGRLREGLRARGLADHVNLILVADHGMAATPAGQRIVLNKLFSEEDYDLVTASTLAGLNPKPGHEAALDAALAKPHPHLQCWHKAELPPAFHYGQNRRVPEIQCLADVGWITTRDEVPPAGDHSGGAHGYDPSASEMAALFIANGPAFKAGVALPMFDNVDVYSLEMKLLGLPPLPSDGSLDSLRSALKTP